MVFSTLPKQNYENYARKLNKRDGQSIRYRLKVIMKKAKGKLMNNDILSSLNIFLRFVLTIRSFLEAQLKQNSITNV